MNMGCDAVPHDAGRMPGGVTRNAARALGLADRGVIAPGAARRSRRLGRPRIRPNSAYRIGFNPLHARIFGGQIDA